MTTFSLLVKYEFHGVKYENSPKIYFIRFWLFVKP